ncbi:hypothetical protein [Sphingomonas profundi]|uniref:hypothetical protein n=1 Tax=Alterirhizorhabdus profundi TaxID=2681549 RepID=UPI001E2F99DA|nr:hypothetical protein [Sphingomonas profundi]
MRHRLFLPSLAALMAPPALAAAPVPPPAAAPPFTYADLTDLAAASPVVADVLVTRATRIKGDQAAGVAPGRVRFYVEAAVQSLVRGAQGLPGQVSWLVDLPLDARGRVPKLPKKARLLLLATTAGARPGELRLAAPYAQFAWTPELDQRLRAILTGLTAADAPPRVTGIGNAFHVPGALPGESETQIFLKTRDNRPISLNVLRRPGEQPRWAVALGEIVDEAAGPPARDTLLWYRLACFLPGTLPDSATAELSPADADAAREDYAFVVTALGACARNYAAG